MGKEYYCPGSCGGVLKVEEWKDNTPKCTAKDCERRGEPLKRREV